MTIPKQKFIFHCWFSPDIDAKIKAVLPFLFVLITIAPLSMSIRAIFSYPMKRIDKDEYSTIASTYQNHTKCTDFFTFACSIHQCITTTIIDYIYVCTFFNEQLCWFFISCVEENPVLFSFCAIILQISTQLPDSMAKINAVSLPPLIAFMSAPLSISGSIKLSGPVISLVL